MFFAGILIGVIAGVVTTSAILYPCKPRWKRKSKAATLEIKPDEEELK